MYHFLWLSIATKSTNCTSLPTGILVYLSCLFVSTFVFVSVCLDCYSKCSLHLLLYVCFAWSTVPVVRLHVCSCARMCGCVRCVLTFLIVLSQIIIRLPCISWFFCMSFVCVCVLMCMYVDVRTVFWPHWLQCLWCSSAYSSFLASFHTAFKICTRMTPKSFSTWTILFSMMPSCVSAPELSSLLSCRWYTC